MSKYSIHADEAQVTVESVSNQGKSSFLVQKTSLPGCDFDGLFTNSKCMKDELVCKYVGKVLRTVEAMRLDDKSYLMRLGEQCYVDAREDLTCYAR